jgi:hypothetical protein
MDFEFWREMVTTGKPAYEGRRRIDTESFEGPAIWCFRRFGSTRTPLPDGRIVCIGGEHEDYYDPDFCIYNDVIVVQPDGDFCIYGYPRDVFPPTDFHTATLIGDRILIVGNVGYREERGDETPVFNLDLSTFAITRVRWSGKSPGWIYKHEAELVEDERVLRLFAHKPRDGDPDRWTGSAELELDSLKWRPHVLSRPIPGPTELDERLTARGWTPIQPKYFEFELNNLRWEVPPGHPLFACNVAPWASGPSGPNCEVLYRLLDGTGRLARVAVQDLNRHAELPLPVTTFYQDVEDLLRSPDAATD